MMDQGFEQVSRMGMGMMLVMVVMSLVVFALIVGVLIFMFSIIMKRNKNNQKSPKLSVYATVVSKRMRVMNEITSYFATFQVDSGDRMELHLTGNDYAMLAEGDYGQLSFKGTEFLEFVRK